MINIKYIFVVLLIAMSLYSYGLDTKPSTDALEILQKTPQFLTNILNINNYPHKIVILKSVNGYDLTNKVNQDKVVTYSISNSNLNKALDMRILNKKPSEQFEDINLYTMTIGKTKDTGFSVISILTDEKNNIIWDNTFVTEPNIGVPNEIFYAKRLEKDKYIVVSLATVVIYIDYIYMDNDIPIIETYQLPFFSATGNIKNIPESVSVLTEDIIRLEYKDGAIEHWKVKLSEDDVNKNMEVAKKAGLSESKIINSKRNSLLWWNGIEKGSIINNYRLRAWNYDDNPTREPFYENML